MRLARFWGKQINLCIVAIVKRMDVSFSYDLASHIVSMQYTGYALLQEVTLATS